MSFVGYIPDHDAHRLSIQLEKEAFEREWAKKTPKEKEEWIKRRDAINRPVEIGCGIGLAIIGVAILAFIIYFLCTI